ncbi:MAG TPA: histidine kinase dimerization/phospho-acceptor domain-containing protein [Burkholderiaceae bacterium]|nr:histidine kinase dimerization/phospho-acceptor domain-containing protein [Burkholderiaceae bacterium]
MRRSAPRRRPTLARHYRRWLVALSLALGAVMVGSALRFVLWPMAQRSADDLAGLMVLAAQTWSELPPETRPAFEEELILRHRLAIRSAYSPPPANGLLHGFYIGFLEDALAQRTRHSAGLHRADAPPRAGPDPWLWTGVPTAGRLVGVGFDPRRLDTHPLHALTVILLVGSVLALGLAHALAQRIARPVARLEQAASELAAGRGPAALPEEGPAELARLARHFNHMAAQVQELLQARTTLLAGASHDLRTPLARMRLALEMLRLKPGAGRLIDRIDADVAAMDALIGQMLDLARGLDREPSTRLPLRPWLDELAARQSDAARAAGATLTVVCDPDLTLDAPPATLGRILDNLLGNALRYAPGPIDLAARRLPPSDAWPQGALRLSVADRGPGIPEAERDAVWRPFHRLEVSRSPDTGGWGLGLAVVRQLAQIHGWRASLRPRDGGGLEAGVELPLR